jgi:putative phosphoesterase
MVAARRKVTLASGKIGLISDTHGLMRSEALAALRGCDLIIHAGDIGKPEVLEALRKIAPVAAIRGNNDRGPWASKLPDVLELRSGEVTIGVIHNVHDLEYGCGRFQAVISGHSHKPSVVRRQQVLFINPGSAGPRRFKLPISVGRLQVENGRLEAKLISLDA